MLKTEKNLSEIVDIGDGQVRRKLCIVDVNGKSFEEKKEILGSRLKDTYGTIPKGVSFKKMQTRKSIQNPDGIRVLVYCNWIKRNRFYDENGKFKFGRIVKAINKVL